MNHTRSHSETTAGGRRLALGATGFTILALTACGDLIVADRSLEVETTGVIQGQVRIDLDGNGSIGGSDPPLPGLRIQLLTSAASGIVDTVTTDENGEFEFAPVPVGDFRIAADPATLPDDLMILGGPPEAFTLRQGETVQTGFGLTLPEYSPAEARTLPPGRQIFTRGIVLNVRNQPGDGVVHIREGDTYLRITDLNPINLTVGDTVRVSGRTALSAGQPILADGAMFRLGLSDQVVFPLVRTTNVSAGASGGTLDAALVRIQGAPILSATGNLDGHLVVTTDDGSGPVEVVLRNFINFNLGQIAPGTTQFAGATGLLRPIQDGVGGTRWQLFPRAQADLNIEPIPPPPPAPEAP